MTNEEYVATYKQLAALSPLSLKDSLRKYARHLALSIRSAVKSTPDNNYLRLLYCHYVFDDQKAEFERLLIALNRIGKFIDTDTCVAMLTGRKKIDGRYFHLSFDDGFRNIFTNAVPVMVKHNIPAAIFVPSQFVSASWDTTRHYCLNITRYKGVIEMIRWDELKEAASLGFDIASHTKTHARLSAIAASDELLENEILGSKLDIEGKIGRECKYFSWPFGSLSDVDMKSLAMVEKSGYAACFGAFRGQVMPDKTSRFSIPRHHFEPQWPLSHVRYFAQGGMEKKFK